MLGWDWARDLTGNFAGDFGGDFEVEGCVGDSLFVKN
jgi:hypothetical protein